MKKRLLIFFGLFLLVNFLTADIIGSRFKVTTSESEFDIIYYVTPDMTVIDSKDNEDVAITQSFLINKNGVQAEVRYSLFTDMGGNKDDIKIQYAMWVYMCISNIAGFEVDSNSFSNYKDSDVKNEFNGDFGCTTFIQNPQSSYGEGYDFMAVEFFYKQEQGLVMRAFLFNSFDFFGIDADGNILSNSPYFSNYHTFRFMEKDAQGNFISE